MSFAYNLRFPGQYYDQETGLFYNYFRDYDPKTGRYVESDPIGLNGGLNTYTYVGSNPGNYADPLGLQAIFPPIRLPVPVPGAGNPNYEGSDGEETSGLQWPSIQLPEICFKGACFPAPYQNENGDDGEGDKPEQCPTPKSHPDDFIKLKGGQGSREKESGLIWKVDKLHKDHYDVSDRKGNKVKEIDFNGNQIWPNGPKNRNKG